MNCEIKRRARVVQSFPSEAALIRLVGAVCCEVSEDWSSRRYMDPAAIEGLWVCLIASKLRVRASESFGPEHEIPSALSMGTPTTRNRPNNVVASVCDVRRAEEE